MSVNTTISWRGRDGATGYERAGSGDSHLLTLDYSETGPVEIAVTFSSSVCNKTTITHYNGEIYIEQYSYYYYIVFIQSQSVYLQLVLQLQVQVLPSQIVLLYYRYM